MQKKRTIIKSREGEENDLDPKEKKTIPEEEDNFCRKNTTLLSK